MTIAFRCPDCNKALTTGEGNVGRRAKCPQCGAGVLVPEPTTAPDEAFDDVFATAPPPVRSRPTARGAGGAVCPMCGTENRRDAGRCRSCGETLSAAPARGRTNTSLEFGDIFGEAWERWKDQLGVLVLGTLLAGILSGLAQTPFQIVMRMVEAGVGGGGVAIALFLFGMLLYLLSLVASAYFTLGLFQIALNVARGRPAEVGQLFSAGWRLPTALLDGFLVGLMVGVGYLPALAIGFGLAAMGFEVAGLLAGFALAITAGLVVPNLFWPTPFRILDGSKGLAPLGEAFAMVRAEPGLTALLLVTAIGLILIGYAMCLIGVLFTSPLAILLYAVAYDRMRMQTH